MLADAADAVDKVRCARRSFLRSSWRRDTQRPEVPGSADGNKWLSFGVLRSCYQLVSSQFKANLIAVLDGLAEMQRAPLYGNLATADAKKTAEIDYSGNDMTGRVDKNVDNMTHIHSGRVLYRATKDSPCQRRVDNRDQRQRCRQGGGLIFGRVSGLHELWNCEKTSEKEDFCVADCKPVRAHKAALNSAAIGKGTLLGR
jgi:hypothetical protein